MCTGQLPSNLQIAEKRLNSVKKKLMQDESLAHQAYQAMNDDYLTKGYTRQVSEDELKPLSEWFLPQFPVVRPEMGTTIIGFSGEIKAGAPSSGNGFSLNRMALNL